MKFVDDDGIDALYMSRPARGAWVEIILFWTGIRIGEVAPRKGRVG